MFPVATPDTQLFPISISKATEKKNQITFKNNKSTRSRTVSVTEHILLKRLNQFGTTVNVYLDTIKQS